MAALLVTNIRCQHFFSPRDLVPVAVGSKAPHPPSLWGHCCHLGIQGCSLLPRLFSFTWHQGSLGTWGQCSGTCGAAGSCSGCQGSALCWVTLAAGPRLSVTLGHKDRPGLRSSSGGSCRLWGCSRCCFALSDVSPPPPALLGS